MLIATLISLGVGAWLGIFWVSFRPTKQLPGGQECFIKHLGECGEPRHQTLNRLMAISGTQIGGTYHT